MKCLLSLLLSLTTLFASAQGNKIELSELGLSFTIPEGWTYSFQDDLLIMGHHTIPGLMIALENTASSTEELKRTAMEGIHDATTDLSPVGEFKVVSNNQVEGYYTGSLEGTNVKCFAMGKINGKAKGITLLVLTEQSLFSDIHVSEAKKLMRSVSFFEAKDTEVTKQWKNALAGRQLKYLSSSSSSDYSGGYSSTSSRTSIKLYANNQFDFYSSSDASFDTGGSGFGYANDADSNSGTYLVYSMGNQTYLELHFKDDRYSTYTLERNAEGHTLLDGTRYFLVGLDE